MYKRQGLGRNYGGFSRADRLVTTFVGIAIAAIMAFNGQSDVELPAVISDNIGFDGINPLSAVLLISLVGGIWTFLTRAMSSRRQLLDGE